MRSSFSHFLDCLLFLLIVNVGGFRSLDENGNPVNHCGMEGPSKSPPFLMSSLCRSDSNRDNRSRIERNDATHPKRRRFNKHFKMNNRQKDINPEEIDGYFGDLDVKVSS